MTSIDAKLTDGKASDEELDNENENEVKYGDENEGKNTKSLVETDPASLNPTGTLKLNENINSLGESDAKDDTIEACEHESLFVSRNDGEVIKFSDNTSSGNDNSTSGGDNNIGGEAWILQPPDGGWGWMVVMGSFVIAAMIPMLAPCFGILYSEFLIGLGASSMSVAWVFNIFMMTWKMTIVLIGPIQKEIGTRTVAVTGGLLAALSVMATAFATSISYLIFFFSILGGLGCGLCLGTCFPTLTQYFQRRRGMANAILMAGISVGQLVNAPLIRYLQQCYSYMGATLIVGALVLHTCPAAALLQPVKWHFKRVPKSMNGPYELLPSAKTSLKTPKRRGGFINVVKRVCCGTVREFRILRERRALVIVLIGAFSLNSHFNFIAMVPFAMQDAGHSLNWAAWTISATAITNTLARIVISTMADHPSFPLRVVYMLGAATVSVTSVVWTMVMSGDRVNGMVVMVVWGCGVGVVMGLHNLAMVQTVGVENIRAVYGANNFIVGLGFVTIGPLVGMMRDVTASYQVSMCMLGGVMSLCVLLWCLMPLAVAYDNKNAASKPTPL